MNGNCPKHLRNAWLTACSALVLALAGCGGDEPSDNAPRIDAAAASGLAERSDEIARLIEEGNVCDAAHVADELKTQAEAEVADGSVPPALADQVVSNAQALVDEVNCEETPPPPPPPEDEDGDEDGGDDGNNGKGKGKDKKDGDG